MKLLFMFLAAGFSLIQSAAACEKPEAQFIGTVAHVRNIAGVCYVHVAEFSNFQESMVCPLDSSTVSQNWIRVSDCGLKSGDAISGYLTQDSSGAVILN